MITNFIIKWDNINNNDFPCFQKELRQELTAQVAKMGARLVNWYNLSGFITKDNKCLYFAYIGNEIDISKTNCVIMRNANNTTDYNSTNSQYMTLKQSLEKITQML